MLDWHELLESDGFKALDMLQTVTRDDDVSILTTRSPIRVDGKRAKVDARRAPHRRAQRSHPRGVRPVSSVTLKGMTWSHPRGYDPMVACSALWKEKTGVEIAWDKRSLQDFESFPVEELARAYDLIVIDHPHVGQITGEGCLAPLDVAGRETELRGARRGKRRPVLPELQLARQAMGVSDRCGNAGAGLAAGPAGRRAVRPGARCWSWRGRARC